MFKKLEHTFIPGKYTQNQVKSERDCESRKFRFWNPEVPDFNSYITIWPVTYPFTPHSLSHILPDTSLFGEAILWRFKDLTKDFKGQRWALGDFNPEVPDPPSGIDFKPFSP